MPRSQKESQRRLGHFTQVHRDRWQDPAWIALSFSAKGLFMQLECFDGISAAGVIRADAEILAQKHPDVEADQISLYLKELDSANFVAVSGSETFISEWFYRHPSQLRSEKNVKSMIYAIQRIGYDDLRETVTRALFAALLDIEQVDKTTTIVKIKQLCFELAEKQQMDLPAGLAPPRKKA